MIEIIACGLLLVWAIICVWYTLSIRRSNKPGVTVVVDNKEPKEEVEPPREFAETMAEIYRNKEQK